MNKDAKISFVTPVYNGADTLAESIESIMDGNFENGDEIIIVNDGSTDGTAAVITDLQRKYPFIHVITQENKGLPRTRNIAYTAVKNPIIFQLYADDVLETGSVPKLKEYMISQKADMAAFAEDRYFQKTSRETTHTWVTRPGIFTLADLLAGLINPGPGGDYMFTKKIWEDVGGVWEYSKGLWEAWGFTLKVLAHGAKMVVMPDSYYFHRYGYQSLTIRELKKPEESLLATKMISHYLHLLTEEDATYVMSEEGSKKWYQDLNKRPLHLKSGEVGTTGIIKRPFMLKFKMAMADKFPTLFNFYLKLKQKIK